MKYWRGYLVAGILAAITFALVAFAKAHETLVDMIYPYMTRVFVTTLADWSGSVSYCIFTVLLALIAIGLIVSVILMLILRWNFIQWLGWVMTVVCAVSLLNTALYGLNQYAGPLADDIHLPVGEYTLDELNEATLFFRDEALALAGKVSRNKQGDLNFGKFETLAQEAGEGFRVLTYDEALPVFAGSTAPVKKLSFANAFDSITVPLTGESAVKGTLKDLGLPYTICKEMAKRMCIAREEDAQFAAFLACRVNPSENFQYSAYCMAYYFCRSAMETLANDRAKDLVAKADAGLTSRMREDLEDCRSAFGSFSHADEGETDVADLLACWYIENYITAANRVEEDPFDPLNPEYVDLEYVEPDYTPLATVPATTAPKK